MKKIIIIDGGPRKNFNTASMLQKFAVVLVETMNGTPERNNSQGYGSMEYCIKSALGEPERLIAYNTYQVKSYDRFELASFSEEAKRHYRDENWEKDLQKASEAGRKMAENIRS